MFLRVCFTLLLTFFWNASYACDVVLSSGDNLQTAASNYSGKRICLNAGTYNLGANTLNLGAGTTLEGLASSRDQIMLSSSAVRAISVDSNVTLKNFALTGTGGEFGILSYQKNGVLIWGLRLAKFGISIGVVGGTGINIWDTFMSLNGNLTNNKADPNIWISGSSDVSILWGEVRGRANGPGGDGEIAAYDSQRVEIYGTQVIDSGASAIYLVNCDYCKVSNTTIHRAGEWGLDIVKGSDYFEASNNNVFWSNFGGSVFDEAGSEGGYYSGNVFKQNRQKNVGACNGINVIGSVSGVVNTNNTSTPTGTICKYN